MHQEQRLGDKEDLQEDLSGLFPSQGPLQSDSIQKPFLIPGRSHQ